jgi:hypothetical protein
MVDLKVMESVGSTNDALKQLFTAETPNANTPAGPARDRQVKLADLRRKVCDSISSRITDGITHSLRNYHFFSSIDLAWATPMVNKSTIPLQLYAQEKINIAQCRDQLSACGCADQFVKKNEKGEVVDIELPKFHDTAINLMKSVTMRRAAAQSNKFGNLWPYLKAEARSTSEVGKLRADLLSQRMDIAADQYGWRHHDSQVYTDALGYGHQVDFVRCAWERDVHWREGVDGKPESYVAREGLVFVNPHPTRIFWDRSHPLSAINDDLGMAWIGFWDVKRYGDVRGNPRYWNRKAICYGSSYANLWTSYAPYFSQYYTNINIPNAGGCAPPDLAAANDRSGSVGYYSDTDDDTAIMEANLYMRIVPKEWLCGDYPFPVWVRLVVAGTDVVTYAEFLPDAPAAYCGVGQKDNLLLSPGFGHELLPYQDQLTNLLSYLLLALQSDNYKVLILDTDALSAEQLQKLRSQAKGNNFASETHVLEISRSRLESVGVDIDKVMHLVETRSSAQLTVIFQAIMQVFTIVERVFALSPQEQGQPAPREISATETNMLAATTESVYNAISDSIDEFRAAKKRIFYNYYLNFGEQNFRLPVQDRYSSEVVQDAGLTFNEQEVERAEGDLIRGTFMGTKDKLVYEYIFTSRDGAERTTNTQAVESMSEILKTVLAIPAVQESMTQGQLVGMINAMARYAGAYDLKLEAKNPDQPVSPSAEEQLQMMLEKMASAIEALNKKLSGLDEQVAPLISMAPLLMNAISPQPPGMNPNALQAPALR